MKSQLAYFRSLGGNYLNVEFGWKPFVSDLRKTAISLNRQADILEDLRRNSGKAMRRQYTFPAEVTAVDTEDNIFPWPHLTAYHWTQGKRVQSDIRSKRTWFAGEFRYYYPPVTASAVERIRSYARTILGMDLTPGTLWDISPWTWLADWFGNVGDVLANVSAINEDNLAMRYGYLMQEARHEIKTVHHNVVSWYGDLPSTITGTTVISHKTRIGASPYGFGTSLESLSPRQVAILAAIGFGRGGRSM